MSTIKFKAVKYSVGGQTGYRPQLESQPVVKDLPFCQEVVSRKRLSYSPEELLHAMKMVVETGPELVAEDGRPRGISGLLKFNRTAKGKLESPTGAWNETCRAYIKPQLMGSAKREIEATFVNAEEGVGVKLDNVTCLGAKAATNVVKQGRWFCAYGKHMTFIEGDTATLTAGGTDYELYCAESNAAAATFAWPNGLVIEPGTTAEFEMRSRGGVAEGATYVSRKTVTMLGPDNVTVTGVEQAGRPANTVKLAANSPCTVRGTNLFFTQPGDQLLIELYRDGACIGVGTLNGKIATMTDDAITLNGFKWDDMPAPSESDWLNAYPNSKLVVVKDYERTEFPITFVAA